jgi:hypothetical protein
MGKKNRFRELVLYIFPFVVLSSQILQESLLLFLLPFHEGMIRKNAKKRH